MKITGAGTRRARTTDMKKQLRLTFSVEVETGDQTLATTIDAAFRHLADVLVQNMKVKVTEEKAAKKDWPS